MKADVKVRVMDTAAFCELMERVKDFVEEYAWHTRDCAAIDADGEWHLGNADCTCGFDEARTELTRPIA